MNARPLLASLFLLAAVAFASPARPAEAAASNPAGATHAVGTEFVDYVPPGEHRTLSIVMFYPAEPGPGAPKRVVPFSVGLSLYRDVPFASGGKPLPLLMLSHGRGSNPWLYAWLAAFFAEHGYIVAGIFHYHANTYDQTIDYLANRIWQRPVDVSLDITHLLTDPIWGKRIDPQRIGIMGHSQGGFTALWVAGSEVNAERFAKFQALFAHNPLIPPPMRAELKIDPAPALHMRDPRIKAALAMAPGIIQAFGMDAAGLSKVRIPVSIMVGASDSQTPPAANGAFAAHHIPGAQLWIIPGAVDHEIFTNECDAEGRDEFPEACIDKPGVDRHAIHGEIAARALAFFAKALN
jgi:predicted dienelactone hydrolase